MIFNEDCINGMKRISDNNIDLVICDLPYGTTRHTWDNIIDFKKMWCELLRITKDNTAILLFAQTPFDKHLAVSNLDMYRYEWIWRKNKSMGFLNANKMPMRLHEKILVFYKKLPTYNPQMTTGVKKVVKASHKAKCKQYEHYGNHKMTDYCSNERYPTDVLDFKVAQYTETVVHPTQKPLALITYLINTYSNKHDLVLDFCIGSGTTAVACIETERKYIGFETNLDYYNMANKRILQAKQQIKLF